MNNSVSRLIMDCDLELSDIEKKIQTIQLSDPLDSNIKYLTFYSTIKAEGTLEFAARAIVSDYFDCFNSNEIQSFIDSKVRINSTSAKYGAICQMLSPFGDTWLAAFKNKVDSLPNKEAIIQSSNSLVDCRHQFAHGGNPTISFSDVKTYYFNSKILVTLLDETINPT